MKFDWLTFGFQLVNILVLLAILRHFLFRPLMRLIAERQTQTQAAMDAALSVRAQADEALAAAKAGLAEAEAARRDALEKAHVEAEAQRKLLLDEARNAAAKILADVRAEAAQTATQTQRDTLTHVRDLAEQIAQKALSALPDPPTVAGFAQRLAQSLADLTVERRAGLLAGAHPALLAPHTLTPQEIASVREILRPAGVSEFDVVVDRTLIAGLELRTDAGVLRNSIAHDLDSISQALGHDDASRI